MKNTTNQFFFFSSLLALLFVPVEVGAAPGTLANSPLFLSTSVESNIMMAIDDSGSMDAEILLPTNDGALWWNTVARTTVGVDNETGVAQAGRVNFNLPGSANSTWKKFTYIFPNGTGSTSGRRVYADSTHDHFAIPPIPQYAFLRSPDYNMGYYDPEAVYDPWPSEGGYKFYNADPTNALAEPIRSSSSHSRMDLTSTMQASAANYLFRFFAGMVIPSGTTIYESNRWRTLTADRTITDNTAGGVGIGVSYYPATYYRKSTSGTYAVGSGRGQVVYGNCANPNPAHYKVFELYPSSLVADAADALGPDGACLVLHQIQAGTTEMQNFANWFSYYRKRHQALRASIGFAFADIDAVRVGYFTINNRNTVTMRSLSNSADKKQFFVDVYGTDGRSSGTPNRWALDHAGQQFARTDANAPIKYSCQKNFTMLFTDGYSTLEGPSVGNQDGNKGVPCADGYSNTLADISMRYFYNNNGPIRPLASGWRAADVPVPGACSNPDHSPLLDCNRHLHMNTFTMSLGMQGTIFGQSDADEHTWLTVADAHAKPPVWPNVNSERDPRQIDDLYHAAVNGRGEMFSADRPNELRDTMTAMLQTIQSRTGAAAAVAFNTTTLNTESAVFLVLFNSSRWSGKLLRYSLNPLDGKVAEDYAWEASEELDKRNLSSNPRVILTQANKLGVPFRWESLASYQKSDLQTNPSGTADGELLGRARLDYIRGERTNEGKGYGFRTRSSRLGDIIHSNPVSVGRPAMNWPSVAPFPAPEVDAYGNLVAGTDVSYRTWAEGLSARTQVLYVGGNDGMLHGFRADNGAEVIAYIPTNLFSSASQSGLHYLTDPTYDHRYYVDLSPAVSDAWIQLPSTQQPAWRSVLIGGQRAGGRGLFALDVTQPESFSEANAESLVLWEFADPDLGYTFSEPTVCMTPSGDWVAIVGNGYNDTGKGTAQLFVLKLEGGMDGVWEAGDYWKLDTGAGSSADRNGLSTPAVIDTLGNGTCNRVYAGDLQGNMWVFDLSDSNSANWDVAYRNSSGTAVPLFKAGATRPITTQPMVAKHPNQTGGSPNLMVYFGTGQYLTEADKGSTAVQGFYGVWDIGAAELDSSKLVNQTFEPGFAEDVRVLSNKDVPYSATGKNKRYGWLVNLPGAGERVVTNPVVRGSYVFFNTMITSDDPCSFGGTGWNMALPLATGGRTGGSQAFDRNGDNEIDADDLVSSNVLKDVAAAGVRFEHGIPAESVFLGNYQYTPGSQTNDGSGIQVRRVEALADESTGRLSWQEIMR